MLTKTKDSEIYTIRTSKEYREVVIILEEYKKSAEYSNGSTKYKMENGGSVILHKNRTLRLEGIIDEKIKDKLLELIVK